MGFILRLILSVILSASTVEIYYNEIRNLVKDEFIDEFKKKNKQIAYLLIIAYFIILTVVFGFKN